MASARPTAPPVPNEEDEIAALLGEIIPRRPTSRYELIVDRVRRKLDGKPLGQAFEQALRDNESYSAEGVARWISGHGYEMAGQSVRKWRAANGVTAS